MRCLRPASLLLLLLAACGSPYKKLIPVANIESTPTPMREILRFKPDYPAVQKELYRCHVDGKFLFKKFHLSGILFFKNFEDGSSRVVFSNEMGHTFFDFGWNAVDSFQVNSIIAQLDKPAVIGALQKDLSVLLLRNVHSVELFREGGADYYRSVLPKGYAYYIVQAKQLKKIEIAGKKRATTIHIFGKREEKDMPDSLSIVHHKAHFTINAKKIKDVTVE
jgi:hypothetical protein